jgi:hypothetical protein
MKCSFCGWRIDEDNTRFCPQCGTLLAEQPSQISHSETSPSTSLHSAPTRISADAQAAEQPRWGNNYGQPSPTPDHPPTRSSFYMADTPPHERPTPTPPAPAATPPPSTPRNRQRGRILAMLALVVIVVASAGVIGYVFGHQSSKTTGTQSATATATVPRALTPTATAVETVVFSDPLTSATQPWPQISDRCLFQNGSYHTLKDYICFAPVGVSGDANVSAQVKQLSGTIDNFYGIAFRFVNSQNFYEFLINSNSLWTVLKIINGTDATLIPHTANAAIKPGIGADNLLLVRAHGAHFQFFVNGVALGQLDDTAFSSGEIGLLGPQPGPADIAWNNFQITSSNY